MDRITPYRWLVVALISMGCATPQAPPGIRPTFLDVRIQAVAIAPAYALDPMGLSAFEHDVLAREVEHAVTTWLRNRHTRVLDRSSFEAELRERHLWQDVADAWYRDVPLTAAFEASPARFEGVEVQQARRLSDHLDVDAILFVQVLYQADVACAPAQVRSQTPYAVVADSGSTCVLSHLEGKLVDVHSGTTIWHNVAMAEVPGDWDPTTRRHALQTATAWLLGSSFGLVGLVSHSDPHTSNARNR